MQVYNTQGSSGLVESYSRIRTWAKQGNKQGNVFFFSIQTTTSCKHDYSCIEVVLDLFKSNCVN